tara:strand:- start:145 stop:960 length:816 start_codon:yes stop_codon:yes gene_type:complete
MTQSETIRVEAIATAIHDTLVADGWTTPECDGESRDNGNGIYYRGFSKEGYATITQGYAVADPDAWRSYVTSLTLGCDGKLIRCTDHATPKKLRAFLVRADKLQDIAKAKAERDDAKKAKVKKASDYTDEYVKQNCAFTWEEFLKEGERYKGLRESMVAEVERQNETQGFIGSFKQVVKVDMPYDVANYETSYEYLEERLTKNFKIRIVSADCSVEEVERFQETLAGVMLIFTGAEGIALRDAYRSAHIMAIAINEAESEGHKAYKAEEVA